MSAFAVRKQSVTQASSRREQGHPTCALNAAAGALWRGVRFLWGGGAAGSASGCSARPPT